LYGELNYPVIELFGLQDDLGNLLMTEGELCQLAKELQNLWNQKIEEVRK